MKIISAYCLLPFLCQSALGKDIFRPLKVSYNDIVNESESFGLGAMMDELSEVGMISITNMPKSFRQTKKDTLAWTHPCAVESGATKEHTFADGTRRRTMASHTIPGGIQSMEHGNHGAVCEAFQQASTNFRKDVDFITRAFAARLSSGLQETEPILKTEDGFLFKNVHDVVDNGEHLEHFHSYQGSSAAAKDEQTVDWHTDQGLFLVFTPGMWTQAATQDSASQLLEETEGFYIELADGTRSQVKLDDQDDLIIMLGDGVNQYVNPSTGGRKLRAVPHALAMPTNQDSDKARVWYGRMVLPPASAVHPEHGETFGHLRKLLIDASTSSTKDEAILGLGCSSAESSSFTHARQLEESSCEEGTLLCWHRCMSLEEAGVSADICAEQDLDLYCINPRGQLWDNSHGDWYPACIDTETAPNATEYPRLPHYPRDNETCTDDAYESYVESNAQQYEFHADLMGGGTLYWNVMDGKTIDGMFSFNGLFGYTALGFAGYLYPDGNAMHGAIIIQAVPSDTYSPVTGFDYNESAAVEEYIIDPKDKSFRHWMTPVTSKERSTLASDPSTYAVEETDCFTAMTFNTAGIFNTTFNISGSDTLIWAANGWDMFAGYHTREARGVIDVEWKTGKVTLDEKREEIKANLTKAEEGEEELDGGEEPELEAPSGANTVAIGAALAAGFATLSVLV